MSDSLEIPPLRYDGLQLEEHRAFQERYWTLQRIAWGLFAVLLAVALLGLTGSGGILQKQTIRFSTATAEIPRVSRWEGEDEMLITFDAEIERQILRLTDPFFARFAIERLQPEPESITLEKGGQVMEFPARGAPPHKVTIDVRAMHFGWTSFNLTIGDETRSVNLLVLP